MEKIRCPYCDSKVLMSDVETDDGTCPECGAPLMGSLIFDSVEGGDDPYEDDDGFDEAADEDGFLDDDDDDSEG